MVVYAPMILRSLAEIKEAFGVGERQIKLWVQQGAPIAVEGEGRKVRYSAEAVRLQVWRERKCLML
ncbi:MerR family transcriptional regulator, partial [Bilophila wadsworthia]